MRVTRLGALAVLTLVALIPRAASAQSAQRVSLQFSGLAAVLFGSEFEGIDPGFGGEAQIRVTPSAFSIGGGFQYTRHGTDLFEGDPTIEDDFTFQLWGGFVEPRVVLNIQSNSVAPYLAARLSVLREQGGVTAVVDDGFGNLIEVDLSASATGFLVNGGGGLLFALSRRVNLDLGLTVGYGTFGDITVEVEGTEVFTAPGSSGGNLVFRAGLAVGLGG